ncbi:MAG: nuclear transport factor 2 family protein [Betaproteobacteria bacterium]|nr:nuclear transport factor 2 family protein [Betaproteobacteria bacterium]MBK8321197.1 nuclear transport factor 2 family protein [Betaproteobacteria bacterium]
MGEVYALDAYFRDPFNEVTGLPAIQGIFRHMYEPLVDPRFVILETIEEGDRLVLTWDMLYRIRKFKPEVERKIHGLSLLRFDAQGRVAYHRDYWDAAGELYAQLPLVGPLMRFLAKKMA